MKNNDAIENDVSAEQESAADEQQGQQKYIPSDRDLAMAEIARQAEKHAGIERAEASDEEESDEQQQPAEDPLAQLGYYKNAAGELVTKIKVNGEEREIKADQLKAYLQKEMAGDLKLQQAHKREQELVQKEQLLREQEQKLRENMTRKPSAEDAANVRQQVKAALEKMYDGDTDAATDTLAELLQRASATVDAGQIESLVEKSAESAIQKREQDLQAKKWQDSIDEGNQALQSDHPEIYADPRLFDLVNSETVRLMEDPTNSNLMPKDIIAKAAEVVSEWVSGRKSGEKKSSQADRKAGLKPVVTGMNKVHRPTPAPQIDTSPTAVIARMRNARASSI